MAGIRRSVWQIPRNFLDLSHVVIGRGKFGSVIKGKVNNRGAEDAAIVQVVPGKMMDEREMRDVAREVSQFVNEWIPLWDPDSNFPRLKELTQL